ncbi:MAG TPA: 30S ribosomal protein S16 [Candidatus Kapabacteria bacterium]|nr:30S ribosomal protein S16 [Candidatus Kapabacteria bacterium]
MVKLRLARQGRKKLPIYKIVAADSRARRDGRFIESLGQYRPSNEPGQKVQINPERALYWLKVGAQPSDTVRSLLSSEGILLKWHLEKKQIEPARAEEIFNTWKTQKDNKLSEQVNAKQRAAEDVKRKKAEAKKAAETAAAEQAAAEQAAAQQAAAAEQTSAAEPVAVASEAIPSEAGTKEESPAEGAAVGDTASVTAEERPSESVEG